MDKNRTNTFWTKKKHIWDKNRTNLFGQKTEQTYFGQKQNKLILDYLSELGMFGDRYVTISNIKKTLNPTFGFSRTATWRENFQYESTNIDSLEKRILTLVNFIKRYRPARLDLHESGTIGKPFKSSLTAICF